MHRHSRVIVRAAAIASMVVFSANAATAQEVGAAVTQALSRYCEPYLAGTPYLEALASAGFAEDPQTGEYHLGAVMTYAPDGAPGCGLNILYTQAEYPEIMAAARAFAESKGLVLSGERTHDADASYQYWSTGWISDSAMVVVSELKNLDGSPVTPEYDGLQIHYETGIR